MPVAPRPRRGEIWAVSPGSRRVLVFSGNMLNDIDDEHVVTMEVIEHPVPLSVATGGGGWVRYTWLDHVPKESLTRQLGEVPEELMQRLSTRLFMVIATD
ncbi:hypothetical protein [Amycolatopsis granulosa]|uniref:hypothetical protein n=1 Tax=Amycolatopsis granulosa TaxID=185684 RepID=UPI00312C7C4A|nr:mRNA-degrading endonuclease toxin of MazEF toxin-antitoxin module [Amycolatopsis granulosa]